MNYGIPVLLTKIKTRDGITLDGIYVRPKRKGNTALIWVHGFTSRFSSGQTLVKELSHLCGKNNIGYFKFNNRGHDIINKDGLGKNKLQGGAFEKFEQAIFDIQAVIREARRLGYINIILAGNSTGANKALYYMYKRRNPSVKGLILLGPISDIAYDYKAFGKQIIRRRVAIAGKTKADNLLPQKFGIWSAQRYVSILEEGRPEDVFPYHNPNARWKELKSVRVPIAVILGSKDEYLDRKPEALLGIFKKNAIRSQSFSGIIIRGANHGFHKKERELAQRIITWVNKGVIKSGP